MWGFESFSRCQSNCLICLPDKSGNFLAFRAKTAQNTVKPEKTGFGMAITARPRPVFCAFRPKIPRTFYFKLTEQSSRKKLAVGGFEPEKVRLLYPAPEYPANFDDTGENPVSSRLSRIFHPGNFFIFPLRTKGVFTQLRRLELLCVSFWGLLPLPCYTF